TDSEGNWTANRGRAPGQMWAKSADGKLATVVRMSADENEIKLHLVPTAEAHGRLVDDKGQLLAGEELRYGILIHDDETNPASPLVSAFGGLATTDSAGVYRLTALVPGQKYDIDASQGASLRTTIVVAAPERAETVELGDAVMPKPYRGLAVVDMTT